MGHAILTFSRVRFRSIVLVGGVAAVLAVAGCASEENPVATATQGNSPGATSMQPSTPTPSVNTITVTETESIPFNKVTRKDSAMDEGTKEVVVEGVEGVKTSTYEVVLTDGAETSRSLAKEETTKKPVDEVTAIGTKPEPEPESELAPDSEPESDLAPDSEPESDLAPDSEPELEPECDPNYSGACVPIDSDVDCAGGSGNGPSYVDGPVTVTGNDIYDLDSDGDGEGCES